MSWLSVRRRPKPAGRHSRQPAAPGRPPVSLRYYSRHSDSDANTGRQQPGQQSREQRRPLPGGMLRYWLQRFGLIVLSLAVIACLIDVLSLSSRSQLRTLGASQVTLLHPAATYQAAADKLLSASIWNHSKLTVDTGHIARQLQHQFPELTAVTVTVPLLAHQPVIYIEPAQPSVLLVAGNGAFVLDERGTVVQPVADVKTVADLHLPQVVDQSAARLKQGQQGLTTGDVSFIQTVVAQLHAKQLAVSSLVIPAGTDELDAGLVGQPYTVKFNLESSSTARQQAGTFLAVKARLDSQHIAPGAYIDVRVPGRAYYK